ncbi:hypothetical protein D8770_27510 [Methylobacterium sp. DB1607]|nr:hypothetical protein [Methylobacterium sp. DB1607]
MTIPHTLPVAEIPDGDATLDAILRQGLDAGEWPFAVPAGEMPASQVRRIADRLDIVTTARARIAAGLASSREALKTSLLSLFDTALDVRS